MSVHFVVSVSADTAQASTSSGTSGDSLTTLVFASAIVLIVVLIWVAILQRRRQLVIVASAALQQLDELNSKAQVAVAARPPIKQQFGSAMNSKSRYDRFELSAFMAMKVLEYENWFTQEINSRLAATKMYDMYHRDFELLQYRLLGRSSHPRISEDKFAAIETKVFHRRKIAYPAPRAEITSTVTYRSPQGQNSYSRPLTWNFDQLRQGLQAAQELRARQSTTQALRQRERMLVTPAVRVDVLRRDGYRCRMCGAAASDGVKLHVDHISPISRGGLSARGNLQTLCADCNLGKGNRFTG